MTEPVKALRSRGTAALMLVVLAAYLVVSGLCYYDGFFRHVLAGASVGYLPAGAMVPFTQGRFILLPWARFPILVGTAYALAVSALALWRGRPCARITCFAVAFGLLLPQASLLLIYLTTLRGVPFAEAAPGAIALVGLPALAVGRPGMLHRFDAHEAGLGWASLKFGQRRLLLTVIALGFCGFLCEVYVGWTAALVSWPGFVAATAAMALACVSAIGLLRLRVWGLFGALGTALLTVATAIAAADAGLPLSVSMCLAIAPPVVVVGLTWPFWRSVLRWLQLTEPRA